MVKFLIKFQYLIFLTLVLCFRLYYATQVVNFTQDQARDVLLMQQMREDGVFLVGYGPKASVGNFYLAPFYYQLHYTLSLFTGNHPLTMHYFITVVESFTPLLLLFLLLKFVRKQIAYPVALLFAISPLVTIFATFAWNPNMIPFLSTLSLLMFINYWHDKKFYQLFLGLFPVALAIHLHYQAVVLVPFVVLMMLISIRSKKSFYQWLLAIFISLLTLIPYILAELQANWHNTKQIIDFFSSEHSRYFDRISKPQFVLTFIPQFFERLFFKESFGWLKVAIGRIIFLLGFSFLAFKSIKSSNFRIIFVYFALILFMLRIYKGDKLDYYMSTLFIMPYFLLALLAQFKKIFIFLFFVIAWLAGGQLALFQSNNQLAQLEKITIFLNEQVGAGRKANIIFHDDNHINIFSYGLRRFSSIKYDQNSNLVVDICRDGQLCDWDGVSWCKYDRGFTYMALYREKASYQPASGYNIPNLFDLRVGLVQNTPKIDYQISEYDNAYGSDLIELN